MPPAGAAAAPPAPSLLARHAAWVRANAGAVAALESLASSATWLLPDRFAEGEAGLEAAHAALGLLSVYHEALLAPDAPHGCGAPRLPLALAALQQVRVGGGGGMAASGVRGGGGSALIAPFPSSLLQVEVLVEIAAARAARAGHVRSKYTPLLILEAVKAGARLAALASSGARLTLDGGASLPPPAPAPTSRAAKRAARAAALAAAVASFRAARGLPPGGAPGRPHAGARVGAAAAAAAARAPPGAAGALAACVAAAQAGKERGEGVGPAPRWWDAPPPRPPRAAAAEIEPADDGEPPTAPPDPMAALAAAGDAARAAAWRGAEAVAWGELLFLLRPVLYVAALRSHGDSSWKPWLLSLAVDAASAALIRRGGAAAAAAARAGPPGAAAHRAAAFGWSDAEAGELARRRALLALYLVRRPAYDAATAPALARVARALARVPLAGTLAARGLDLINGVTSYYSYTAGS